MKYSYKTAGVCTTNIDFDVEDGILTNLQYTKGCNGNTSGISSLVEGMKVEEIIKKLKGIKCDFRETSCPDQLAIALEKYLKENE